jgi:hypothetical protein
MEGLKCAAPESNAISNVREKQSKQQRLQGPQPVKAEVSSRTRSENRYIALACDNLYREGPGGRSADCLSADHRA